SNAAFGTDERHDVPDWIRFWIAIKIGDAFHELQRHDRRNEIFADAALQQLPIEQHVVDVTYHDHLRACIAAFGKPVELGQHAGAIERGFNQNEIGCRVRSEILSGRLHPAHLDVDVSLGEPPILGRALQGARGFGQFAESLNGNARDGSRAHTQSLELAMIHDSFRCNWARRAHWLVQKLRLRELTHTVLTDQYRPSLVRPPTSARPSTRPWCTSARSRRDARMRAAKRCEAQGDRQGSPPWPQNSPAQHTRDWASLRSADPLRDCCPSSRIPEPLPCTSCTKCGSAARS